MSVKRFMLAGGALALLASSANAAFVFTTTRTPITTGAFAGLERVNLIGDSDTNSYSIGAIAVDTFGLNGGTAAANSLKFRVPAIGNADVYPPGGFSDDIASSFNPGSKGSFAGLSDGTNLATPDPGQKAAYSAGLDSYNVVAFYQTPVALTKADAPGGFVFASAVVPAGTTVTFSGNIDPDLDNANGNTQQFSATDTGSPVPEPTSLCFLGLAGVAAFGRRRRQA
jgi:hypothetical protein